MRERHGLSQVLGAGIAMGVFLLFVDSAFAQEVAQQSRYDITEQIALWWVFAPTVVLAGISEAMGQSFVLFVNRVRPTRFIFSILLNTLLFAFGYFQTVFAIWLVGRNALGETDILLVVMYAVGVGYGPLLLAFLSLLPYVGVPLLTTLYFFSYLLIIQTLVELAEFPVQEAVLAVLLSFIVITVLRLTIGRPIVALNRWLRNRIAGTQLERDVMRALDSFDQTFSEGDYEK